MGLIVRWWDNPDASATIFIAVIAGIFALYQLNLHPAEMRRKTLIAMQRQYEASKDERGRILRELPCLTLLGYQAIYAAVEAALDESARNHVANISQPYGESRRLAELRRQGDTWNHDYLGISCTDAHEILSCEFKFRAFMWCIETIRDEQAWPSHGLSAPLLATARSAVDKVNSFVSEYENGTYPARNLMGQLHLSLANVAKALEPIIWEGRGKEGRWGRRILRIGIASQHYNDISSIHRITPIVWKSDVVGEVLTHPALTKSVLGREIIDPRIPLNTQILPLSRLHIRSGYWRVVGILQLRPRFLWAYGGRRLRQHRRAENRLAAALNFAIANHRGAAQRASTNFDWSLSALPAEMSRQFRQERAEIAERTAAV